MSHIKRHTADETLGGIVERAGAVNSDDRFVMGVDRLFVYGPYVSGNGPCESLDVGVSLSCKWSGETARYMTALKRDEHRLRDGDTREDWPNIEVLKFLKGHRAATLRVFGEGDVPPADAMYLPVRPVSVGRDPAPTLRRCSCGCRARLNKTADGGSSRYAVGCWGCRLFTEPRQTLAEAVDDWNGGRAYYL